MRPNFLGNQEDDWSTPQGRIQAEYQNCVDTWQFYMSFTQYNPYPYNLISRYAPPEALTPELEKAADDRSLFGAFMLILSRKDLDVWEKYAKFLLSPIRLEDGSVQQPTPEFLCRVHYLTALYRLGERTYPKQWRMRIGAYLRSRWPEYKDRHVNVALIEEWETWLRQQETPKLTVEERIRGKLYLNYFSAKLSFRSFVIDSKMIYRELKNYWKDRKK